MNYFFQTKGKGDKKNPQLEFLSLIHICFSHSRKPLPFFITDDLPPPTTILTDEGVKEELRPPANHSDLPLSSNGDQNARIYNEKTARLHPVRANSDHPTVRPPSLQLSFTLDGLNSPDPRLQRSKQFQPSFQLGQPYPSLYTAVELRPDLQPPWLSSLSSR